MTRLLFGVLITAWVAVAAIGFLIRPEDSNEKYWFAVAWCEVLVGLNWFASASIFSGSNTTRKTGAGSIMGALPGINVAIFIYTIISFSALVAFYNNGISPFAHLIWQITSGAVTSILVLLMLVATKGAIAGSETQVSKADLLEECRRIERAGAVDEVAEAVIDIKNFVSHRMRHPAKLDQKKLSSLYQSLQTLSPSDLEKATSIRSTLHQI